MSAKLPSNWKTEKIGNICHVGRGSSPRPIQDQRFFEGGDIPWVKIADATKSGKYLYETKQYVNEHGASFSRIMEPGTIIVAASGTLGYTQILGVRGCVHDGWLYLVSLRDIDRDFLYYALQLLERHFYNQGSGAAIQNINTDILRATEFPYPPLPIQERVGRILSAYDDLIENNQRRIRILEEMAQRLYREWFVHFRFPGHHNTPLVDSPLGPIPEGWEVKKLGDFGDVQTGKTPSKKREDYYGDHMPFIKLPDMHGQIFCTQTTDNLSKEGAESQRNKTLPPKSICVSCIGTAGIVTITSRPSQSNQQINSIILNDLTDLEFLFFALRELRDTIVSYGSTGATMTNLSRGKFVALQVVYPPPELLTKYHEFAAPMFDQILNNQYRIENSRRTRDLLLPKLISGHVEIPKLIA